MYLRSVRMLLLLRHGRGENAWLMLLFVIRRQVFVANPKKPPQIETILRRNKDKLLLFLKNFHNDKEGMYHSLFSL